MTSPFLIGGESREKRRAWEETRKSVGVPGVLLFLSARGQGPRAMH